MKLYRCGWIVFRGGSLPEHPLGVGAAREWRAVQLWWRFYLVVPKPDDPRQPPLWARRLRDLTRGRRAARREFLAQKHPLLDLGPRRSKEPER